MTEAIELSEEEISLVGPLLARIRDWGPGDEIPTVGYLIQHWASFVQKVEEGYTMGVYDYTDDLDLRASLDELLAEVPESLRAKLLSGIHPWDERFYAATREVERSWFSGATREEDPWWFYVPKKLFGELEEDLRAYGAIE